MSGLGITLNDIWAYEIWIKEIKEVVYPWMPNHKLTYLTLNFIYFDHFGLDYPDLEKKELLVLGLLGIMMYFGNGLFYSI